MASPYRELSDCVRFVVRGGAYRFSLKGADNVDGLMRASFIEPVPRIDPPATLHFALGSPFLARQTGSVELDSRVDWQIVLRGGAAGIRADLRSVRLRGLVIGGGASDVELELGAPLGHVEMRISGGAIDLRISRPRAVDVRLDVRGKCDGVVVDGKSLDANLTSASWSTPAFEGAHDRFAIAVLGGAKNLAIIAT